MAQCKQTPQEFIKSAFTPLIAVMCTPEAEKCCEKNNLDFVELLQPFSKLTAETSYKDPNGAVVVIKNLKLTFLDMKVRPPHPAMARKLLNSSVSDIIVPKDTLFEAKEYKLNIPSSTPWYECWRDTYFKVQYHSDHEFTKHFLACLLVVSSSDKNPVEVMVQLAQNLNQIQSSPVQGSLPKWFNANILKYYVMVHDNIEGDFNRAHEAFESLKTSYGVNNCFLLRMNSRPPGIVQQEHMVDPWSQFLSSQIDTKTYSTTPESSPSTHRHISLEIGQEANETRSLNYHPLSTEVDDIMNDSSSDKDEIIPNKTKQLQSHGTYLSAEDVEQVKTLIFGFVKYCLLPYVEKQILILNDAVSIKKGVSKSLFSATKRWFSANKPGASAVAVNNLIYSNDSPELQIRRLGDLYFMFGNYLSAFQAYHLAKRDYNADQAWLYYAGALEMAALSAFMANESSRKTFDYMEESITTYLNTCKMPHFATRATILSLECLKAKSMYGEAAHQLIRMTSEDSDLRSALLLEQAAYCFLLSNMLRKYAFHMVLGGHRFSKAAQKKHSLRCYRQAYRIYENTGWDLATDHIHYTIGRQANNLQQFGEAVESFSKLLHGGSKQTALQQAVFLKEYLTILESKLNRDEDESYPSLPIPELNASSIKVLLGPTKPLSTPGKVSASGVNFNSSRNREELDKWHKLEEMLVAEASGSTPLIFKPTITLYMANALEKTTPTAIINEPIQVSIQLVNVLQTVLVLQNIYLLWAHENDNKKTNNNISNESADKCVKTYITKSLVIQANSTQDLILSLMPLAVGNLTISGVCYTLSGSETLSIKGAKVLNVSSSTNNIKPIDMKIVPFAPCLQMTFSEINLEFLAGQIERIAVDLQNMGSVPIKNILLATSVPHLVSKCDFQSEVNVFIEQKDIAPAGKEKLARKNHVTFIPLSNNILKSGERTIFHLYIKAPPVKGPASIDVLIYYENVNENGVPRYRLIRHSWKILVQESITIDMFSQTSYNSVTEEELALALKVTNLNNVHNYSISTEITLSSVVMISKNWVLFKDIVTPKYINLNSRESAHILFKATRRPHKESHYSLIRLSSDKALSTHLQKAYMAFARKAEKPLVNIFEDHTSKCNDDGILSLEWQALVYDASNRRIVHGHTTMPLEVNRSDDNQIRLDKLISDTIIDINIPKEFDSRSENSQKQVTYNLIHPSIVAHNFGKQKTCIVPVTLVLHSIVDRAVSVTVNTVECSAKPVGSLSPVGLRNLCWLASGKIMRTLNPLTTTSVQLSVIVTSPGTFDLGANLEIFCNGVSDEVPVLQSCVIHSTLIIQDTIS